MKRFKSCLLASTGLVILAVTLSFTTPGRAFAQRVGEDCIRICNTASNPLHVIVQGITRVTGDVRINNENAIATTVTGPVQVSTSRGESLSVVPRMRLEDKFQKSAWRSRVCRTQKFLKIGMAGTAILPITVPRFFVTFRGCNPATANRRFPFNGTSAGNIPRQPALE